MAHEMSHPQGSLTSSRPEEAYRPPEMVGGGPYKTGRACEDTRTEFARRLGGFKAFYECRHHRATMCQIIGQKSAADEHLQRVTPTAGHDRLANKLASPNQEGWRTNFLLRKSERFALSMEAVLLLVSLLPSTNSANCMSSPLSAHALPEHEERRLLRFIQSPSFASPAVHPSRVSQDD